MKRFLILTTTIFFICSCHSGQPEAGDINAKKTDTAKKNYLPVADYLKAEIALVDSFPLRIMKYQIVNGKTDSGIITTPVFDQLAKEFLLAELDSSHFEKQFEENSFVDRTTNLVSFTYSTKDTGYGLKRVDVLLLPGPEVTRLSSIYMETISGNEDGKTIRKMSWKAGKNFSILRLQNPKNKPESSNQTIVIWDSRD
jgi:hypothetical protein